MKLFILICSQMAFYDSHFFFGQTKWIAESWVAVYRTIWCKWSRSVVCIVYTGSSAILCAYRAYYLWVAFSVKLITPIIFGIRWNNEWALHCWNSKTVDLVGGIYYVNDGLDKANRFLVQSLFCICLSLTRICIYFWAISWRFTVPNTIFKCLPESVSTAYAARMHKYTRSPGAIFFSPLNKSGFCFIAWIYEYLLLFNWIKADIAYFFFSQNIKKTEKKKLFVL